MISMGKSTAAGNVTAAEFTTPTVVRDALGRDHVVGEGEQPSPGKNSSASETTESKQPEKSESDSPTGTPADTSSSKSDASGASVATIAGATGRATTPKGGSKS